MSRSSIALANLRAVVIVIVLAFHAVLPYLVSLPAEPYRFNAEPYRWQAFPVIDSERWFGFDLFCAWQDLSLMALMFFLSGLFVMASLSRKGAWGFLSDRLVRIGIPLALVVLILMPVAYYPAYRATAVDPSVAAYWRHWLALPFWPPGPQWFLYQLLLLNAIAAALYRFSPGALSALNRAVAPLCESPVRFFWALVAVSAAAYVPLAMAT
jgi:glucans biosynthesis protein C